MNRKVFLEQNRIGVLLRTFAQNEADIPNRVEMVRQLRARLFDAAMIDGRMAISSIDVLVWADKRFANAKTKPDCGKTAEALRYEFQHHPGNVEDQTYFQNRMHVREVEHGDLFCGVLNYGVAFQSRDRIDYSLILSPEAFPYVNRETFTAIVDAAVDGALATGVAIKELEQSIFEGRLANTFAMWNNTALQTVGGFDCRAELPIDDRYAYYFRGWDGEPTQDVLAGVEEVVPLARLVQTFGRSVIAPILPQGEVTGGYQIPDQKMQPDLFTRHTRKMASKLDRQTALLAGIGFSPSYLKGGVMPAYRHPSVFSSDDLSGSIYRKGLLCESCGGSNLTGHAKNCPEG